VVAHNDGYEVPRWVPGLIGFGDDGGPTLLAFDTRRGPPYPVVAVPFVPMELGSVEVLSGSFGEFVGRLASDAPENDPFTG
jgi:hypothetical protein